MDEATVQSPKRRKLTDFFPKFPRIQSHRNFLYFFDGTSPQTCLVAQLDRPSVRLGGQRKDSPRTLQFSSPRAEDSQQSNREEDRENAKRGVYRSYSLRQKLEIVHYARSSYCTEDQGRRHLLASEFDKELAFVSTDTSNYSAPKTSGSNFAILLPIISARRKNNKRLNKLQL